VAGALRHDFARTFKSKSVIISMAVIIALSLGLIPLVGLTTSVFTGISGGTTVMEYNAGGEFHFLAYSYNTYGQPVEGTPINITITGPGAPGSSMATTNSSGFAAWTASGRLSNSTVSYVLRISGNTVVEGIFPPNLKPGEVNALGGDPSTLVTDPSNSSRTDVLFAYEGPFGARPTMYRIYYGYSSSPTGGMLNESQMTFLGSPSTYVSTFKLPQPPSGTETTSVGVFDANGTLVSGSSSSVVSIGGAQFTPPTPEQLFTSFVSSILSLVVPLMAILVAYNSYGKDKATGVLESVLTRPVTRRGLGLTRYLAILISISIALVVTVTVMEGESQALLGKILPPAFALYTIGALVVEAAAFVGLTMLVSHVIRSTGGIIGVGVGLWIVLDFFWGILIFLGAYLLGVQIGSGNYLGLTIDSGFLNPAQYYGLVVQYLNGVAVTSAGGANIPISPATYGLTPFTLVAAAAFWIVVPLAGFLYLATHRD
jgi:ABC-2 type transport system permease protein